MSCCAHVFIKHDSVYVGTLLYYLGMQVFSCKYVCRRNIEVRSGRPLCFGGDSIGYGYGHFSLSLWQEREMVFGQKQGSRD